MTKLPSGHRDAAGRWIPPEWLGRCVGEPPLAESKYGVTLQELEKRLKVFAEQNGLVECLLQAVDKFRARHPER